MCEVFVGNFCLVGQVKDSRVGGWCRIRKGGSPGSWTLLLMIQWIHAPMDLSDFPHVEMVQ